MGHVRARRKQNLTALSDIGVNTLGTVTTGYCILYPASVNPPSQVASFEISPNSI